MRHAKPPFSKEVRNQWISVMAGSNSQQLLDAFLSTALNPLDMHLSLLEATV